MLYKTKAIVLNTVKYGDSSIIVSMYTEKMGKMSFIIKGVRKPRSRIKQNIFQSLSLLSVVFHYKPNNQIHYIREVQTEQTLKNIHFNLLHSTLALFIAEVVNKSIGEEETDAALYSFLHQSIIDMDQMEDVNPNFHLIFLMKLSGLLGFNPLNNFSRHQEIFDLQEGVFCHSNHADERFLKPNLSLAWHQLMLYINHDLAEFKIGYEDRLQLLTKMLDYYKLHISGFGTIKSLAILREVMA
jgi:DNA repair protein RecO (recombination protein O)